MKKFLLITLTLVLAFTIACFATETRVTTLGEVNHIVKDDYNIFLFPSTINYYKTMALAEVKGMGDLYRIGGHYDLGEDNGVLGVYIDEVGLDLAGYIDPATGNPYIPDPDGDYMVDNRLNIFYGRPFGDNLFGVNLSYFGDSYKVEDTDKTEESTSAFGFNLGLTMAEKLDIAAGIGFTSWTYKNAAGDDVYEPESNLTLGLHGRYWYAFNDDVDFIPYLGFEMESCGFSDAGDNKTTWSDLDIGFGCGTNVRPDDRILMLFDLGFSIFSETEKLEPSGGTSTETTYATNVLPYYRVGLEGHVTKWWDLRLGANKSWVGSSMESGSPTVTQKLGVAETTTYLGSGFHFGNLTIDIWVEDGFLTQGPNFVSGYTGEIATMASVKYEWK